MNKDIIIPNHIAIIMDGNGRWANGHNLPRVKGHSQGVYAVRSVVKKSIEIGVKTLTLFAFSSENKDRPKEEVGLLFKLFLISLQQEVKKLNKNNIKLKFIGDLSIFPQKVQSLAIESEIQLQNNTGLDLVIAANYGGKWDITQAFNKLKDYKGQITENIISENLAIKQDVDLLIRTSGDQRISNFLLWQSAYSELYFTSILWPDFNGDELEKSILEFNKRKRKFGKL